MMLSRSFRFGPSALVLFLLCSCLSSLAMDVAVEPYPMLNGGNYTGTNVTSSPDPLIAFQWHPNVNTSLLQYYLPLPVRVVTAEPQSFTNLDSFLTGSPEVTVNGAGTLMFDFQVEHAGWLEFDCDGLSEADLNSFNITMSISETDEVYIDGNGPKTDPPVQSYLPGYGSTFRLQLNGEDPTTFYEGVRFGWIRIGLQPTSPFTISGMRLVSQIKPVNYTGSFSSSDTTLDKVWYSGAYTVRLNLLADTMGTILLSRGDRGLFNGDLYIAEMTAMLAFGEYDLVKEILFQSECYSLEATNCSSLQFGSSILTYHLYWVGSVLNYYWATGDTATFVQLLPTMIKEVDRALVLNFGSSNGTTDSPASPAHFILDPSSSSSSSSPKVNISLGFVGWDDRVGAGFRDPNCDEGVRVYAMLTLEMCFKLSQAATAINNTAVGDKYQRVADDIVQLIRSNATSPQRRQPPTSHRRRHHADLVGVLAANPSPTPVATPSPAPIPTPTPAPWYSSFGLHAAAGAINAGFCNEEEKTAMYASLFSDPTNICSYSPFNSYFILEALGNMNQTDAATAMIKLCWGGMLDLSGQTFWEIYSPQWNNFGWDSGHAIPNGENGFTSLCHPWSSGVTMFMSSFTLGIKPTLPGFATFDVRPRLGSALFRVQGSLVIPSLATSRSSEKRVIQLKFDALNGEASLLVPPSCEARFAIPLEVVGMLLDADRVSVNGILLVNLARRPEEEGSFAISMDASYLYVDHIRPGHHYFTIPYGRGMAPSSLNTINVVGDPSEHTPTMPAVHAALSDTTQYAAKYLGDDKTTNGNWTDHGYGGGGYVLFDYLSGATISSLPSYVDQVVNSYSQGLNFTFATNTTDTRALQDPFNTTLRSLGALVSPPPPDNSPTLSIDVLVNDNANNNTGATFNVSVYCVDFDSDNSRSQVLRVMDYETMNLIAPEVFVDNFSDTGHYYTWSYNASMRIRVSLVRGVNAVLSGVFFSET
eukprot:TRINITY_DN1469_c0_g1_i1.p1 TRINITY_DN1469_c0_g1~~TRINITY_DN1469_c0_g1_i1.p1  ORF type:complete len:985 (+),score=199.11 TRINITY_DN1469_c0_g1_i1:121-3075(+)